MSLAPATPALPRHGWLLAAAFVLVYILPLGARPLARPDEVRYGAIAKEMIRSGDWVSPHFNGVRYFQKPVLGYWIDAASLETFGDNAFALRLPSALATGLTALLVFWLACEFADGRIALLAAGIFLSTFEVLGLGTFALLDAFLSLFLTAAIAFFYAAHKEARPARRRRLLIAAGAAVAAAFLTKGFLALAIPVVVLAPYLAARRRWRDILILPWLPLAVALVLVLPWSVLIQIREPDFWHQFFWVEHVQRFAGADAQHAEPPWYYFVNVLWAGLPWIWLLPAAVVGLRRSAQDRSFTLLLICWAAMPFILFSLAKGKLITYLLPCFAPLAILLAIGLHRYLALGRQRGVGIPAVLLGALFAAGLGAVLLAQTGVLGGRPPYAADGHGRLAILLAAWGFGFACAAAAWAGKAPSLKLGALGATAVALLLPIDLALPAQVLDRIAPGRFITRFAPVSGDTLLISDASTFGSVAWFLNRNDVYVISPGEIRYGLSYPDGRKRYLATRADLRTVLRDNRGRREILIICDKSSAAEFRSVLPPTAQRSQRGDLVSWRIAS
jgi:4-amino-4-deoxy-L-arabinose transferase